MKSVYNVIIELVKRISEIMRSKMYTPMNDTNKLVQRFSVTSGSMLDEYMRAYRLLFGSYALVVTGTFIDKDGEYVYPSDGGCVVIRHFRGTVTCVVDGEHVQFRIKDQQEVSFKFQTL